MSEPEITNKNITAEVNSNTIDIYDSIKEYVNEHNPVLYILTPCYGSVCFVNFVHCLMQTKELFSHFNIQTNVLFCKSDSLVSRARNNLVAKAMTCEDMTHMMFIDNDITWDPFDILKLLIANKPISGGIYPLKSYNFNKILPTENNPNPIQSIIDKKDNSLLKKINNENAIQMNMLKYNVNYVSKIVSIENNLTKVKHIATGFMLIQRNAIEKMSTYYPETKYTDDVNFLTTDENKYAYALFDCGVVDDHYLSEDWMFCNRWSSHGGELWIDITINLTHTGIHDFKGCYMSSIL
jgi:hypothetical protein